jgi:hypothetical protein
LKSERQPGFAVMTKTKPTDAEMAGEARRCKRPINLPF